MFDPLLANIATVLAAVLAAVVVSRRGKRAADEQAENERRISGSAAQITDQATFRHDILARLQNLEQQLADERRSRERDRQRWEAREDQLIHWGMTSADPIPRQPPIAPIFVGGM